MDDQICFTMKLMFLMTIQTAPLHTPGGMKNHGCRVPVGFPTPSDYRGVGKPTVDVQLCLWDAVGWCKCLNT